MTYEPEPPQPPQPPVWDTPPPAQQRRRRRWPWIVGAVVVVAAVGVTVGLIATSGGPGTFTVHGSMTLDDSASLGDLSSTSIVDDTDGCRGTGGYGDLVPGAEVVISDDAGKTLVITHLDRGVGAKIGNTTTLCRFPFEATVPKGKHFYGFTISHRGTVKMSEAEAPAASLTIGGS